jgi:hypothetical protein
MLSLSLSCTNEISEPLFSNNLSDTCSFEKMKFDNKIFDSSSTMSSFTPLFSLDRTQNDFNTQSVDSYRNSGYIRGTQEVTITLVLILILILILNLINTRCHGRRLKHSLLMGP